MSKESKDWYLEIGKDDVEGVRKWMKWMQRRLR